MKTKNSLELRLVSPQYLEMPMGAVFRWNFVYGSFKRKNNFLLLFSFLTRLFNISLLIEVISYKNVFTEMLRCVVTVSHIHSVKKNCNEIFNVTV